jgi:hypothetical protein
MMERLEMKYGCVRVRAVVIMTRDGIVSLSLSLSPAIQN